MIRAAPRTRATLLALFFLAAFVWVLVRTAWLSDDSYIIFRTIDNFIHGFGLRWNVAERVQTFTDPLWTLLLASFYAITREIYWTCLIISMAASVAAVGLLFLEIAASMPGGAIGAAALIASKAFTDFSTSGLENPLTHLLLAFFLAVLFRREERPRNLAALATIAGMAAVNRPDTILFYLPALLGILSRLRSKRALLAAMSGALPPIAWEIFSILYYGFPFPNTAYAKLSAGIPSSAYLLQGLIYLRQSLLMDPVTLTVIAAGLAFSFLGKDARVRWIGFGTLLYLLYVVRIGGDFMSGRFLTGPLFLSAAALSRSELFSRFKPAAAVLGALLLLGLLPPLSPWRSGRGYGVGRNDLIDANGICDERGYYYQQSGLLLWKRGQPMPKGSWADEGRAAASGEPRVLVRRTIGQFGFFAGPRVHVVDELALSDAFLARLPLVSSGLKGGRPVRTRTGRIGHLVREVPKGYLNTLASGRNRIVDSHLAAYYDKLSLILKGPLFDSARLREIVKMNLGRYDGLIRAHENKPSPRRIDVDAADIAHPKPVGTAWDDPDNIMMEAPGLEVRWNQSLHAPLIVAGLDHNDAYEAVFLNGDAVAGMARIEPSEWPPSGVRNLKIVAPAAAAREGYDRVRIVPLSGDGLYSLSHLRPLP